MPEFRKPLRPEREETVGKIASDLMQKELETTCPVEQAHEMTKPYMDELFITVEAGKKDNYGDFFVVVLTKRERLLKNVIRNYFFYRQSCPTPEHDQAVYQYSRKDDAIDFLWVIPSKSACDVMKENALDIPEDQRDLFQFVLDFSDGSLAKKAKKLNNEDVLDGSAILKEA